MLTTDELKALAKAARINTFSIFREYCQTLFLNYLSQHQNNQHFFFKGGTAIRLIYQGSRFSEDLDFTIQNLEPNEATDTIEAIVKTMAQEIEVSVKPVKSIAGKCFKMTIITPLHPQPVVIKIDLSFRDFLNESASSVITGPYPIFFNHLLYHYTKPVILAEKVHAIQKRTKGRDLYDIWYLVSTRTAFNLKLITKKLNVFGETYDREKFIDRIISFPKDKFIDDLAPFVNDADRPRLPEIHDIIITTLPKIILNLES